MEMPEPTSAHRKLERLAGTYKGQETLHPSPWDATGGVAEARNACRVALGGFAVIGDFEQYRDGERTFQGHGIFTYDPQRKDYVLHWFDCGGQPPNVFRGDFEGDTLKMVCNDPPFPARLEYDLTANGRIGFKLELSGDGGSWQPCIEGSYERQE